MIRGLTAVGGLHNLSMCKRMKLMIYDTRYSSPWEDFRKKIGACGRMALVRPPMPGGLERTKGVLEASHGARAWLPLLLFTTAPPRSIASPRLAAQQSSPWEPSSQAVSALGPRKPSRTRRGGGGARVHIKHTCRATRPRRSTPRRDILQRDLDRGIACRARHRRDMRVIAETSCQL